MAGRVTASHVGVRTNGAPWDLRVCARCGHEARVNARSVSAPRWMCRDCKSVDPAMARRLGLIK